MKFKGYNRAIIHHICICGNYFTAVNRKES